MSVLNQLVEFKNEIDDILCELSDLNQDIADELTGSISYLDEAQDVFGDLIKDKRSDIEKAIEILDRVLDLGNNEHYLEWDNMIKQIERDKVTLIEMLVE